LAARCGLGLIICTVTKCCCKIIKRGEDNICEEKTGRWTGNLA
jgi:hypothetical protein